MTPPHLSLRARFVCLPVIAALISALIAFGGVAQGQVTFLDAGFEGSSSLPVGWAQSQISGTSNWTIQGGGNGGEPAAAHGGSNNAFLFASNTNSNQSQLVSPAFDTTGYTNISLTFWHAQAAWSPDQDELKVFYSSNDGSTWTQLVNYTASVPNWTERSLAIPVVSANTRIKFEGNAKWGRGVCLDDIQVTGISATLSEVFVSATDAEASEVGSEPGTWTITRSGNTTGAVNVNFTLSGNATSGIDYNLDTTSPVSFAAGETTKVVTLTPVDDAVGSEAEEVATLTLGAGTGYVVGTASDDIAIYDDEGFDVNILIIGSTKDSGERHNSSVWWNAQKPAYTPTSEPFSPTEIGSQLQNIMDQDSQGSTNVHVEERYMSQSAILGSWTAYSYNLMSWFSYPYPADAEAARWANLRGEGGTEWDYVVLIGDPYTMEYTPGMYALGVSRIAKEVAKGTGELVLLMPWQHANSDSSVNHYKEVVYRAARSGGHKVAAGALAWQDCGSPGGGSHPTTAGAYIAASSIYSSIYNQSAAASNYSYSDANANTTFNTHTTNNSAPHYSGLMSFQSPYLMVDDKRREVHFSETGTSTEQGFKGKIKSAMTRSMVSAVDSPYNDKYDTNDPGSEALGWPTSNPMPIGFNYGRDGFSSEAVKKYMVNPAYWQAGFGYYYQQNTWPQTAEAANDIHIGLMHMHDNDLANRMLNEAPSARNIPVRTMWAQIHKLYPTLRPQRDGSGPHLSYNLDEAVGTFLYTMYSGRCPLDPEPATDDVIWNCRRIGYETAWMLSRCHSRAPGFKVTPSSTNKKTIASGTTETMSVVFILPPENDVTVTVASSSATAAIVGPKTLTFTPANYNVPQLVTVAALPGTLASEDFNVTFATSSSDEAYDSLSDSWAYTATRSSTTSLIQVDNGTSDVTAFQNTPLTINLNTAGSNASNTILLGAVNGSVIWTSDSVIEYTPNNGYLGNDTITYAATVGGTQTIGCINITVVVPNGQVNATVGDASALEEAADTGTFVINRVGDTSGSLNVLFAMSGTATFGSDYTLSHSSPVTIPDGQASITITLTPVDDSVFGERYESAVLSIVEDAAYPIGTASAVVTITDNDNNAPVANAGTDQNIAWSGVTTVPGLHFGELAGNMDETTPNPKSLVLVDVSSKTEDSIATNTTEIFTGQIYDADGQISFTEHIDDKARIWIDGVLVINNDVWGTRSSTINLDLTPGWHDIEIRISNGSGGSGPVNNEIGIGYDPAGGTTWQTLIDPGDGSLLKANAGVAGGNATLDGSATDVNSDPLTYSWTVVSGPGNVTFGDVSSPDSTAYFDALGTYVLRLTVDDGFDQDTDEVTITVNSGLPSIYATWAGGTFTGDFNDTDPANNGDGDDNGNMMEFAFGTDPTISDGGPLVLNGPDGTTNGQPIIIEGAGDAMEFYFVRRKADHGTSGSVSYTVQFSTDLTSFTNSVVTPTVVADSTTNSDYEIVKVAFPTGSKFGRIEVDFVP